MTKPDLERVAESIAANAAYLHKEAWAERAAELREAVRHAQGEERVRAEQALRDHHKDRHRP